MAEYMRFSENAIVHKIPESLSHEDAVLIEPMACAIHTVARGDIQLDDVVVLAGAGPLGLCMVQVARLKTPKKLIVIDAIDERPALAKEFGADVVINPLKEDADQIVKSLTGGYGCDVYIEATGAPIGVTRGLQMIRKLGRFVEFSVFGKETTVDWSIIGDRKELDIRGAHGALQLRNRHRSVRARAGDLQWRGYPQLFIERLGRSLRPADSTDSIKVIRFPDPPAVPLLQSRSPARSQWGPAGRPNVKTCCCSDNQNKKLPYRRIGYVFIFQKTLPFIVAGGMLAASHGALAKQITIGMSFQK